MKKSQVGRCEKLDYLQTCTNLKLIGDFTFGGTVLYFLATTLKIKFTEKVQLL